MKTSLGDAGFTARETAKSTALQQWDLLHGKGYLAGSSRLRSFIDPEALILISLALQHHERRFAHEVNWLMQKGRHLINFKRLKTLVRLFPSAASARLGPYAYIEWQQQAQATRAAAYGNPVSTKTMMNTSQGAPDLSIDQSLLLRLRAGFGTSIETDLLACLIGFNDREIGIADLAAHTGYSDETIEQKVNFMVLSRFIKSNQDDNTPKFRANNTLVSTLLKLSPGGSTKKSSPTWISWFHIFSFLAQVEQFTREEKIADIKPYALSKMAGKLVENHKQALTLNQLEVEDPTLGTDYFEVFNQTVRRLTSWLVSEPME